MEGDVFGCFPSNVSSLKHRQRANIGLSVRKYRQMAIRCGNDEGFIRRSMPRNTRETAGLLFDCHQVPGRAGGSRRVSPAIQMKENPES